MAQPYVGEIRMFAGNFPPAGWEFCNGQLMSISENEVLFQLIGTTYGGDGQENFALPNLQSRMPIHMGQLAGGSNYVLAQMGGVEQVTLTTGQMPAHTHSFITSGATANSPNPANNLIGLSTQAEIYYGDNPNQAMNPGSISSVGNSQPHENMQPYLVVSFIISLFGIFPSPN